MLAFSREAVLILISFSWLARGLDVPLSFYTSTDCKTASIDAPSVAFNLSTCIVTPGLVSLHYGIVSCAGGGTATAYLFKDTACANQQSVLEFYKTGSDLRCLSDFPSGSIAAIMLSCNHQRPENPVATSTVSVGQVVTGAAPAPAPSTAPLSDSGKKSSDGESIKAGWNSLSLGARVGIIAAGAVVAISFGVVCIWCCCCCCCSQPSPSPSRIDHHDYNNDAAARYDSTWKTPATSTQEYTPCHSHQLPELSGTSNDDAYLQVLTNVVEAARHKAASDIGFQDNSNRVHSGHVLSSGIISSAFANHDPRWKHKLGAAGELYVFEYLRRIGLPNFGPQNWTSSLRTLCGAHPDYQHIGPSRDGIADLEYSDDDGGTLTKFLLSHGYSFRGIQRGVRLTYRFEVKATTSSDWKAPFYMSQNQEMHIRNALITPSQTNQVYVICRISNLGRGDETRFDIYLDPEALRREGRLIFSRAADGEYGPWKVQPI